MKWKIQGTFWIALLLRSKSKSLVPPLPFDSLNMLLIYDVSALSAINPRPSGLYRMRTWLLLYLILVQLMESIYETMFYLYIWLISNDAYKCNDNRMLLNGSSGTPDKNLAKISTDNGTDSCKITTWISYVKPIFTCGIRSVANL